jgi:hypothetical protein
MIYIIKYELNLLQSRHVCGRPHVFIAYTCLKLRKMASGGLHICLSLITCFTKQNRWNSKISDLFETCVLQILVRTQAIMIAVLVVFFNPSKQMWDSTSNLAMVSFCILSHSLSLDATQSKLHSSWKVSIIKAFKGTVLKLHKCCVTVTWLTWWPGLWVMSTVGQSGWMLSCGTDELDKTLIPFDH